MRALCLAALLLGSAVSAWSQTVYYTTSTGENHAKETWRSSSLAGFRATPPDDVYESYTVKRKSDGSTSVHRNLTTPSGDWGFEFTYAYGPDGHLRAIRSVFVTCNGITSTREDEGLTRCVRTFRVSPKGILRQTSERITDEKSGRVVTRQFYQPQVEHWMSLSRLPIPPETPGM